MIVVELWIKIALWIVPVIFAVTLHEIAHGWAASYFGDNTAKNLGRLKLNPVRHIDPVGSVLVPGLLLWMSGMVFGWAKPVPVNVAALHNPKRDMGLVALAGPAANLVMAIFWAFIMKLGLWVGESNELLSSIMLFMGVAGVLINTALMMFNLLPLPPLDGGRVLAALLPMQQAVWLMKLERWGFLILVLLLVSGLSAKIIWPMMEVGLALSLSVAGIPMELFSNVLGHLLS
ncbi:MAG: site-2 protease family protein [Gammaproteobacteria bacterium]|nr:site-2 protease family protein [Gammaproteobacteria bacterium]